MMQSINPYNLEIIGEYTPHSNAQLETIGASAHQAYTRWKTLALDRRAEFILAFASTLLKYKEEAARIVSLEMGKPILDARAEIEKCIVSSEQLATTYRHWFAAEQSTFDDVLLTKRYEALGVILLIMPWNFPFWQVIRCAIPAMLAGNTIVLKHAPNVSGCSLLLEKIFQEAGFPAHTFSSVLLENDRAHVLFDLPQLRGVSLTGSERAGMTVASLAGKKLLKTVLELGGSDPFIVLPDASLSTIIPFALRARLQNSGQSCIAGKRFLLPEKMCDEFISLLKQHVHSYSYGNPLEETTKLGPLARVDLADQLKTQIQRAVTQGTTYEAIHLAPVQGAFSDVGILSGQKKNTAGRTEEFFGPVFSILPHSSEQELIELSNETAYGLGASIWGDPEYAQKLSESIECGNVFINDIVRSDARWPFGGQKNSGYGKELGQEGVREFTVQKIVVTPNP